MDTARKQETDIGLLTAVYSVLGRERLYSTIGVLTYASTKPPDSRTGPLEYEAWSTPRTRSLQFAMMATANDRTAQYIIAPAENHPRCRVAAEGEPVLPSGVRWISNLLGIMSMFMGLSSAAELPKPKSLAKKAAGPSTASMDIRRLFAVRPSCLLITCCDQLPPCSCHHVGCVAGICSGWCCETCRGVQLRTSLGSGSGRYILY
ncbi:MAG: hypothetical protein HC767_06850 [Akkermansiaceae bacterium]|nr:hypothetical protein [Akkermansiaceae bacterium]